MKALVVTNDFLPRIGGINDHVTQVFRRFPPGEVVVFASSWPGAAEHDRHFPHPVIRWPGKVLLPTPAVLSKVIDLVRRQRPAIVVFGAAAPLALMGPLLQRRLHVPFGTFTYGLETGLARLPGGRAALAWIGRHAALVTFISTWADSLLRPVMKARRAEVLPCGVDTERFHPGVPTDEVRRRHALGDGPVICSVSRLVRRKGQDQLIRALPRVISEFPQVRLLVAGEGPDRGRLERLARRHGVSRHVVMAGAVPAPRLPAYFRAGDVFAMPCRSRLMGLDVEALGAVYLQASAVGRPVVAGDTGGVADAVRHQTTGLLVNGRSVTVVGDAVLELLGDKALSERMGEAGTGWIRSELTWDEVSRRLREMLLEVTAEVET